MSATPPVIWARPERKLRGPVPSLTRERIAAAAVALADAEGIEAVSMRTLAGRLEVGPTSLYRYVERKDEVVDLMVDAVFGEAPELVISGEWRNDMRAVARGTREVYLRHPWMATAGVGRPRLGPNSIDRNERMLAALAGTGLEVDEMLIVVGTIDAFVRGHVLRELGEAEAARRSGLNRRQWMESQAPFVDGLLATGRYPMLARVVEDATAPHDPDRLDRTFGLGLEYVLDGLATMLPA